MPKLSKQAYARLVAYLDWLKKQNTAETPNISATGIGKALGINDVVVRKDLGAISKSGKPKTGYETAALTRRLEEFLGFTSSTNAALAGAGHLGGALLNYKQFESYGLKIVAAFDSSSDIIGTDVGGVEIFSAEKIEELCWKQNVEIGIITVPKELAQQACDAFARGGVKAIWNFAPQRLAVPSGVALRDESMAASLAILFSEINNQDKEN